VLLQHHEDIVNDAATEHHHANTGREEGCEGIQLPRAGNLSLFLGVLPAL